MRRLLGHDPLPDGAPVLGVRRPIGAQNGVAGRAADDGCVTRRRNRRPDACPRRMSPLRRQLSARRAQSRRRRILRNAALRGAPAQVRQAAVDCASAGRHDDGRGRRRVARSRRGRSGAAALDAQVAKRIQPGVVARLASRCSRVAGARARPGHAPTSGSVGARAAAQRATCLRDRAAAMAVAARVGGEAEREDRRPRGRRVDDRRDAGGVRESASGRRGARGTRAYGSASCRLTTVRTSRSTSSGARSPSIRCQPAAPAWRW